MSKLYLVPTPIGNLEDITFRAIRLLKEADVILAENTRKSGILLNHYKIQNKLQSYHQFNEHKSAESLVQRISSGEMMVLITDAGTPGISDPGFYLIRACLESDIEVECLPGATAFVPALVNSGLPSDHFIFEGFLPTKKGRQSKLQKLIDSEYTLIFYESPHRLAKTLKQFGEVFGEDRKVSVSRELTKIYEETIRGSITEVYDYYKDKKVKGEIVIILAGKTAKKTKENPEK